MNTIKSALLLTGLMMTSLVAVAQPKAPSTLSNPLAQVLVVIMILLALAIAILGNVVNSAATMFRDKLRKERAEAAAKTMSGTTMSLVLMVGSLLATVSAMAQSAADAAAAAGSSD